MFDNLRERLLHVQGNIAASFRGKEATSVSGKSLHTSSLNFNAGVDVLARFQDSWSEIHNLTVENAKQAELADELIGELHKKLSANWKSARQASSVISKVPQIILDLDQLSGRLGDLDNLIIDVEKSLINLENILATRELQDRQLDHRFQLALYKEKKLSQLEATRVNLAREHAEKVAKHEARQLRIKRERQEAFEQQFKQDLSVYKETNSVPKVATRSPSFEATKLEEVVLEAGDSAALDEFLHDSTPEKAIESTPSGTEGTEEESA